jgi:hypothetical protein
MFPKRSDSNSMSPHPPDVLAAEPGVSVRDMRVDDAGFVSDHRLVLARSGIDAVRRNPPVVCSYRRIRDINTTDFERSLRNSSLFTAPSSTAETFAEQMQHVIVGLLDDLAPLRHCTRRPPKPSPSSCRPKLSNRNAFAVASSVVGACHVMKIIGLLTGASAVAPATSSTCPGRIIPRINC